METGRRFSPKAWHLVVFVLVVYAGTFRYPFFFDDDHFIATNEAIHTWKNLAALWTSGTYTSSVPDQWGYRPLTTFLYSLCWLVGGGGLIGARPTTSRATASWTRGRVPVFRFSGA